MHPTYWSSLISVVGLVSIIFGLRYIKKSKKKLKHPGENPDFSVVYEGLLDFWVGTTFCFLGIVIVIVAIVYGLIC